MLRTVALSRLFRRGNDASERDRASMQALSQLVEGTCRWEGCDAAQVAGCSYVDRRHRPCATTWCIDHIDRVGSVHVCRRHATVLRALGDAVERGMPDLETRAPSLVTWVSRDLGEPVSRFLQDLAPNARLSSEPPRLVTIGRERVRTWQKSWGIVDHTGFLHRVDLQVEEEHDDELVARLDGAVIGRAVPPWITARREGRQLSAEEDAQRRRDFYEGLLHLLADRVQHPVFGAAVRA